MSEGPLSVMQLRSGGVRQSRRTNFTARRLLFGREIGWGGAGVPIPGTASACPASNHVVNTWQGSTACVLFWPQPRTFKCNQSEAVNSLFAHTLCLSDFTTALQSTSFFVPIAEEHW
jgi:hypothetical protein